MKRVFYLMYTVVIVFTFAATAALDAQEKGQGPTHLIITYQCDPANRVALREYMEGPGVSQFEKWKKSGVFADYLILFNSFVDADTWDMMVILSFKKYVDTAEWKEIEKKYPGGLTEETLRLVSPKNTYSADMTWHEVSKQLKRDPAKAVYFVIPYDYTSKATYKNYAEVYVIPQMKGWIREGIMTSYSIFLNNHQTGKPWDVLFVLEYKDIESFAMRDIVKWKVRAGLKDKPDWKLISDTKWEYRTERETVISEAIIPKIPE